MTHAPQDAAARKAIAPVICYPTETLPQPDMALYEAARATLRKTGEVLVRAREAGWGARKTDKKTSRKKNGQETN